MGFIVTVMWLTACVTLQHQKGFKNYPKNTDWKQSKHLNK